MKIPLAAAAIVFVAAVGTTQLALHIQNRNTDEQIEQLGRVYLDGLVAAAKSALEAGDATDVQARFMSAFSEQHGIAEQALFAFRPDRTLLTRFGDAAIAEEKARQTLPASFRMDAADDLAWIARPVTTGTTGFIVAALDVSELMNARWQLVWAVILVDLAVASAFGALAYWMLRRMSRPIDFLADHLLASADRSPEPLPANVLASRDDRTVRMFQAYNRMLVGVSERERMARELAEREQAAALGRLSAVVAHEVRNPLGGLAAAVSTLKRFGADTQVRDEALGLLERGIETVNGIVTSVLNVYRPEEERRLTPADLEDLRHLVRLEADKRNLTLDWHLDLPSELEVGAIGVRQVLLNLLLNACAATREGGTIGLSARLLDGELVCEVMDQGPGLDGIQIAQLAQGSRQPHASGAPHPTSRRLGMDVIVSALGHLEGRASVTSVPDHGTKIRIAIPLEQAP